MFDIGRLSLSDLARLGQMQQKVLSIGDYLDLLTMLLRCATVPLSALPITKLESVIGEFAMSCARFFASPTPDADALLRRLDDLMNGGIEQR